MNANIIKNRLIQTTQSAIINMLMCEEFKISPSKHVIGSFEFSMPHDMETIFVYIGSLKNELNSYLEVAQRFNIFLLHLNFIFLGIFNALNRILAKNIISLLQRKDQTCSWIFLLRYLVHLVGPEDFQGSRCIITSRDKVYESLQEKLSEITQIFSKWHNDR